MLGNECVQNSFENKLYECFRLSFSNHRVCCNPLTFHWFHSGLAWNQTRHRHLLVDDDELNTKLSFELGDIRQRINSTFVIVRAQISRMETKCFTTPSPQT